MRPRLAFHAIQQVGLLGQSNQVFDVGSTDINSNVVCHKYLLMD